MQPESSQNTVLISSYTGGQQKPSIFEFKAKQSSVAPVLSAINPSFIVVREKYIYLVCENEKGQLVTISRDFTVVNVSPTNGDWPCHIAIDQNQKYISTTNYKSGTVMIYELQDGVPKKGKFFLTHQGSSVNQQRQSSPHPHSSLFLPDRNVLLVADLGTDVIYYYDISESDIEVSKENSVKISGAGPRHMCLGPQQDKTVIVACELDSTIRILSYKQGPLSSVAAYRVSNNPTNYPSEVTFYDNLIFMANRGDNLMMVFTYEKDSLKEKFRFKIGQNPRHFALKNKQLYVACQNEGKVYRYKIDEEKILQLSIINIEKVNCIAFLN